MTGISQARGSLALSELEALIGQHIDDRRFWAVYADALCDAGAPQAEDVRRALEQGASAEGPAWEAQQLEVEWHYGHWKAAWVTGGVLAAQQVLQHPRARFLQHLVLPLQARLGLEEARAPSTLTRLEVLATSWGEAQGTWPDLSPLGALSGQLRELRAPCILLERASPAPSLVRLEVQDLVEGPGIGCLPCLEILELTSPTLEPLMRWEPAAFPALRCLRLGGDLSPLQLGALLQAPLGRALRQLEVTGQELLPFALEHRALWDHLERLVLDEQDWVEGSAPRLVLRQLRYPDEDGMGDGTCLRVVPPLGALAFRRAMEAAYRSLGLRPAEHGEHTPIGLLVPDQTAFPLARALAAHTGRRVQVIERFRAPDFDSDSTAHECSPEGLIRAVPVEASPWSDPNARIPVEPGYDADRIELESELQVVESDYDTLRAEVEEDPDFSGYEEDGSWEPPEFLGAEVGLWVPVDWRPDPFPPTLSLPAWPRRLALEPSGEALELGAALGAYLCWRAFTTCVLEETAAPDIRRWTVRMLRRHRLQDEPADPSHPYWTDWKQASGAERAARSSSRKVPSYKLVSRGYWLLCGDEARLLASALRTAIPHHRTPPEHADGLAQVLRLLELGQPLEVTVR